MLAEIFEKKPEKNFEKNKNEERVVCTHKHTHSMILAERSKDWRFFSTVG